MARLGCSGNPSVILARLESDSSGISKFQSATLAKSIVKVEFVESNVS